MILKYRRYVTYHNAVLAVGVINCWVTDPAPDVVEKHPWFVRWIDLTWISEEAERPSL